MAEEAWKLCQTGDADQEKYKAAHKAARQRMKEAYVALIKAAALLAASQKQFHLIIHVRVPEDVLFALDELGFEVGYDRCGFTRVRWDVTK